jgi:hypothetical protein
MWYKSSDDNKINLDFSRIFLLQIKCWDYTIGLMITENIESLTIRKEQKVIQSFMTVLNFM